MYPEFQEMLKKAPMPPSAAARRGAAPRRGGQGQRQHGQGAAAVATQ